MALVADMDNDAIGAGRKRPTDAAVVEPPLRSLWSARFCVARRSLPTRGTPSSSAGAFSGLPSRQALRQAKNGRQRGPGTLEQPVHQPWATRGRRG